METYDRPLSDARYAPIEKRNSLAMRGTRISLWFTKIRIRRQFGEGFILERTVPEKNRSGIRFLRFEFFSSSGRMASDRATAPLHKAALTACLRGRHGV